MWMPLMKSILNWLSLTAIFISLVVSAFIAGLLAWFTRASFWYAFLIVLCGILINGWIASAEDRDEKNNSP